jgi:5-methylcytosine-specific restriction protein A
VAKPFAKKFYKSKMWHECREAYIQSVFGLCERRGCGEVGDIVHHKIKLTADNINDPKITLNFDNLELLCLKHHNQEHFKASNCADGLTFDDQGRLVKKR